MYILGLTKNLSGVGNEIPVASRVVGMLLATGFMHGKGEHIGRVRT